MRIRPGALLLGALIVGAGGMARAEEPAAPLRESQQALRQMQKDQAQRGAAPSDVKDALPRIDAPDLRGATSGLLNAATAAQRKRDEETKRQRKRDSNWLVDGMLGLEGKRPEPLLPGEEEEEEKLDASDPDFLLKTYIKEQQAKEEASAKSSRDTLATETLADPMAPFLQQWLSGSPVEKIALEAGSRPRSGSNLRESASPEMFTGLVPGTDQVGEFVTPAGNPLLDLPGSTRTAAENPFLQGLDLSGITGGTPGPGRPADVPSPAAAPVATRPPASVYQPLPDAAPPLRNPDRKSPPSALKENEKYFPQQKKF